MRIPQSKQDKGFTLIELLVVVVIIGILAAVAIPVFLNQREKAADAGTKSDLKNAATLMETYFVDEQSYGPDAVADNTQPQLADLQQTDGVTITITSTDDAAGSFCLDGENDNSDAVFSYDSGAGGLQDGACA